METIRANDYTSTTVSDLIAELETDNRVREMGFTSDEMEAIATHIIMTDTDYDGIPARCLGGDV